MEVRCGQVHVDQGVFQIFMTEEDLKGPEINAGLIQMCGEVEVFLGAIVEDHTRAVLFKQNGKLVGVVMPVRI